MFFFKLQGLVATTTALEALRCCRVYLPFRLSVPRFREPKVALERPRGQNNVPIGTTRSGALTPMLASLVTQRLAVFLLEGGLVGGLAG